MKRYHDHSNSYKRKHLIGDLLIISESESIIIMVGEGQGRGGTNGTGAVNQDILRCRESGGGGEDRGRKGEERGGKREKEETCLGLAECLRPHSSPPVTHFLQQGHTYTIKATPPKPSHTVPFSGN